jgi:hypothetical protein
VREKEGGRGEEREREGEIPKSRQTEKRVKPLHLDGWYLHVICSEYLFII